MAHYTCILLDVDNTLLDFNAAERQALGDTLRNYELPCDEETLSTYHVVNRALWDDFAKGKLNQPKLFSVRFARFMQALGMEDNGKGREMNDYYEERLALYADVIPGAPAFLNELSEVATLAIVSNGAAKVQQARIEASGIGKFMDGVYVSEQVGASKPSAKIFEVALKDLGITDRSHVLMVGDDLQADIKGGLNAGIDTCWVNLANLENTTGITPKFAVTALEDVYKIVMEPEELENIGAHNRRHMNEVL